MAYKFRDLSVLAYANGFTLWHYTTPDIIDDPGYFDPAADMLRRGDIIIANDDTEGDIRALMLLITEVTPGREGLDGAVYLAGLPAAA